MAYADFEESVSGGYPVELYSFIRESNRWDFNSSEGDLNIGGIDYLSVPIQRDSTEQNQEMPRKSINIEVARNVNTFLDQFIAAPPTAITLVTIRRYHAPLEDFVIVFQGRILNIRFDEIRATVRCEPSYTSLKRPGLRRLYSKNCPHVLYGPICGVNSAAFKVTATLLGVVGTSLNAAAFAGFSDGYFTGGFVSYVDTNGDNNRRFILDHVGTTITLDLPIPTLAGGANIDAFPGCTRTLAICNNRFANEDNYGGQPFYPEKNPMRGSPIF